ncbi:murein hydrolase activator EnvC family protein [Parvimonas parva]|uniref:murein hydrolase activator EnvC family protein n=1 Tax=Parvimonas parva TaxID=2769485 RepID=UPI0038B25493
MKKKRFLALLLLFSMLGSGAVSYADKVEDLKKEKQNQEQNLENKKKSIEDMTTEKDSAFKEIVEKQKLIDQLDKDLTDLEDAINKLSDEIQASKEKIKVLEERIKKNEDLFKKRVRVMYGNKDLNSIEVLFSASDIRDFISRYFMMQSIADYDKKLITSLKNDKATLVKEKENLEARKEEKVAKKKEMEIKYQTYTEEVAKNKQRIAKLEESIEFTKSEVDKLQNKVKNLDANISFEEKVKADILRGMNEKKIQQGIDSGEIKARPSNGEMMWPLSGYYSISSPFGWRNAPIGSGGERHRGIDIPAPTGTPVYSATDGVVISSGWNGSYGNAVMIQYTNNIVIVYGHNSSLVVSAGQRVSKGQVISLVGSTGNSTGPHLHFEVRYNGYPVDPLKYLNH